MNDKNSIKIIGDAIREGRRRRGWTQKDLATFMGVHTTLISKWENYKGAPTGEDLHKLAIELDIVPLLFAEYFPDTQFLGNFASLQKEVMKIKQRLSKVERKVLV